MHWLKFIAVKIELNRINIKTCSKGLSGTLVTQPGSPVSTLHYADPNPITHIPDFRVHSQNVVALALSSWCSVGNLDCPQNLTVQRTKKGSPWEGGILLVDSWSMNPMGLRLNCKATGSQLDWGSDPPPQWSPGTLGQHDLCVDGRGVMLELEFELWYSHTHIDRLCAALWIGFTAQWVSSLKPNSSYPVFCSGRHVQYQSPVPLNLSYTGQFSFPLGSTGQYINDQSSSYGQGNRQRGEMGWCPSLLLYDG